MHKWRPPTISPDEQWHVSHQIVVPKCYHKDVLSLTHELPLAGHLGINKTYQNMLSHFIGQVFIEMWLCFAGLAIPSNGWKIQQETPCSSSKTNSPITRSHQDISSNAKIMMRSYCLENQKDWDESIPFLMFAAR